MPLLPVTVDRMRTPSSLMNFSLHSNISLIFLRFSPSTIMIPSWRLLNMLRNDYWSCLSTFYSRFCKSNFLLMKRKVQDVIDPAITMAILRAISLGVSGYSCSLITKQVTATERDKENITMFFSIPLINFVITSPFRTKLAVYMNTFRLFLIRYYSPSSLSGMLKNDIKHFRW